MDAAVIVVIVVLNAVIGFTQALRADSALAALRELSVAQATLVRGGALVTVPATEVTVGDIVVLAAGNQVPADLRLLEVAQLRADESALTGESLTVAKSVAALDDPDLPLGDRTNLAFRGTTITNGRARGVVVAVGMETELGAVAGLLNQEIDQTTPLQRRLADFGRRIAVIILVICAGLFALGLLRGEALLTMALTSIGLAVAAIPEALPAVVTVLLAVGARRMAGVNALIRRLPSVETLGSVSIICTDKTGTLTVNQMRAKVVSARGRQWHPDAGGAPDTCQRVVLVAAALCNDAVPGSGSDGELEWRGDPTETALAELASRIGLHVSDLRADRPRVHELPFDSERKRMTTFHSGNDGLDAFTKGAPERVIPQCTAQCTPDGVAPLDQAVVLAEAEELAAQGLRVLALAHRGWAALPRAEDGSQVSIEAELTLIGLVGLIDPPRAEAAAAVQDCLRAGITPVMITGDHPATATAIAGRLGFDVADDAVVSGPELAAMSDEELTERCARARVYARVDPAQKIRIVEALQAGGQLVAMTGDGVNDAPALHRAEIGVAMGRGGTDVAREASGLVLLDDNFATIVAAVKEGRRIYDNIRKFVRYAMTGNSAEILTWWWPRWSGYRYRCCRSTSCG